MTIAVMQFFENVTLQIEEIKKYMDNNIVNAKKKTAVQVKSIFLEQGLMKV